MLGANTPLDSTNIAPFNVSVRPESASVCVPLAPPTVMNVPVNVVSSVTVYVPLSAMRIESLAAGTRPRLQLDATLHDPPAGFVHDCVCEVMLNAELAAAVTPEALAARV